MVVIGVQQAVVVHVLTEVISLQKNVLQILLKIASIRQSSQLCTNKMIRVIIILFYLCSIRIMVHLQHESYIYIINTTKK